MSTEFTTRDGTPVATRFWGGTQRGTVVRFEMTKQMFPVVANRVVYENGVKVGTFQDWVSEQRGKGVNFEWQKGWEY